MNPLNASANLPMLPPSSRIKRGWLLAGFGCGLLTTLLVLTQTTLPRQAAFMAGVFVVTAFLWITEALPLFATALLAVLLQIILLANPGRWPGLGFAGSNGPNTTAILSGAVEPVLLLFFGGFVMARAAESTGLDKTLSAALLRRMGNRPGNLLAGVMLITTALSCFMSNTATTAMVLTLIVPLVAAMPPGHSFRKALTLCVPLTANIGGLSTPVASPPNAIAIGLLQEHSTGIGFAKWMMFSLPLMGVLLLLLWRLLLFLHPPGDVMPIVATQSGPLSRNGRITLGIFAVAFALWFTDVWHGLPAAVVAGGAVIALIAAGVVGKADVDKIEWNILILIMGGLSLGTGLQMTGLSDVVANFFTRHALPPLLFLTALVLVTILIGTFMSNTAAANLLLPVVVAMTVGDTFGLSLHPAVLGVAFAASLGMSLPISTPPNAMAYARGEFTTWELARLGLIIAAAALVLIPLWLWLMKGWL